MPFPSPSPLPGSSGWRVQDGRVALGEWVSLAFHRTLRVPEDGRDYPLPPGLGRLPVHRVADFAARAPAGWRRENSLFVPLFQREALWVGFDGPRWHPSAVTIAAGGINVVTGHPAKPKLTADPQNYLVVPDQPWIDGFRLAPGAVRQFVAAPLGLSATVGEQLGSSDPTALRIALFDAVPGRFPDEAPPEADRPVAGAPAAMPGGLEIGFAAGGRIEQLLYADPYGIASWRDAPGIDLLLYAVNSEAYEHVTGRPPPPSPISAEDYTRAGLPWFTLYEEGRSPLAAEDWLHRVKTLGQVDPAAVGGPVTIDPAQVKRVKRT